MYNIYYLHTFIVQGYRKNGRDLNPL